MSAECCVCGTATPYTDWTACDACTEARHQLASDQHAPADSPLYRRSVHLAHLMAELKRARAALRNIAAERSIREARREAQRALGVRR